MSILKEILEWSKDRPAWQRDALRRLVLNGDLSDDDIGELAELCKSTHGLAEPQEAAPLSAEHVPTEAAGAASVSLESIFHHRGVNALAEDQTLRFAPTLTVVYGDNAAGKTGYIRILKSACRARGREKILGNVVSGAAPPSPVVAIKYRVGAETTAREWDGSGEDEFISRVSVFDTQCAAVYLTEKTNVAFRPFGLDLFDKLVKACKSVRAKLESDQRALASNILAQLQADVPPNTAAAKLLAGITSLTKPETVRSLAQLSPEEQARLALLEKSLLDLLANEPEKLIKQLGVRANRVKTVIDHLKNVEAVLSADAVKAVFDARADGRRKSEEAKRLRELSFPPGVLAGTGTESWTSLWEAARTFSRSHAFPDHEFPFVEQGAACVLCQQDIEQTAAEQLRKFESFVASATERELRQLRETFSRLRKQLNELRPLTDAINETLGELRIDHEVAATRIAAALAANESRRSAIVAALAEDCDLADTCPAFAAATEDAETIAKEVVARIAMLRSPGNDDARKRMTAEAQELRGRVLLAKHEATVLEEIERKRKLAAFGLCIDDTRSQAITQRSTAVTKATVSHKLKQQFQQELRNLNFRHVEVELAEAGGSEGVLYHKLALTRAPGVELPRVVSEGEQRCLSIAAFFAELSTADEFSGIVFDDPVSSLDYRWREGVAIRLVEESKTRQVAVFTHDVAFLHLLKQFAKEQCIEQLDQHVQQARKGAGVCAQDLPWVAMPVKRKIGHLKNEWQAADRLQRDGHDAAYEKEAQYLYGLLRAAWERALEEVLLDGVVERFRPSVQTKHIGNIADIEEADCRAIDAAMTKCSKWLAGHDEAAAARAPVPDAAELRSDIEALETWVEAIRKRRK